MHVQSNHFLVIQTLHWHVNFLLRRKRNQGNSEEALQRVCPSHELGNYPTHTGIREPTRLSQCRISDEHKHYKPAQG